MKDPAKEIARPTNTTCARIEELDRREDDGLEVSLIYGRATTDARLLAVDEKTGRAVQALGRRARAAGGLTSPLCYADSNSVHDEHMRKEVHQHDGTRN